MQQGTESLGNPPWEPSYVGKKRYSRVYPQIVILLSTASWIMSTAKFVTT